MGLKKSLVYIPVKKKKIRKINIELTRKVKATILSFNSNKFVHKEADRYTIKVGVSINNFLVFYLERFLH